MGNGVTFFEAAEQGREVVPGKRRGIGNIGKRVRETWVIRVRVFRHGSPERVEGGESESTRWGEDDARNG